MTRLHRLLAVGGALLAVAAPRAAAELPEGLTFDDGYAYFRLETVVDYQDGKPVVKGWFVHASLRIWGQAPRRSLFKLVLAKNGQTTSTTQGEAFVPPDLPDTVPFMVHQDMWDKSALNQGEGEFTATVYYVSGADDSEHLARTYTLLVRKVTRVRGTANNPEPDAPMYYLSRHNEALSSVIMRRPATWPSYLGGGDTYGDNKVDVLFNLSTTEEGQGLGQGNIRARVNGQPIELMRDEVYLSKPSARYYQVIHTHRNTPEYRRGNPFSDEINFRQYIAVLPLTFGPEETRSRENTALEQHPGNWEVDYRVNGRTIRTWKFTVGADGTIQPHPEEAAAGLGLAPGAHLCETVIPADNPADRRVVPAEVALGGFYRLGWKSDEAKAMAAAVPAIGTAEPGK